jgi:acetylornithine deacetylase/succinyl-diaminopimelate desuccinylase-like protein
MTSAAILVARHRAARRVVGEAARQVVGVAARRVVRRTTRGVAGEAIHRARLLPAVAAVLLVGGAAAGQVVETGRPALEPAEVDAWVEARLPVAFELYRDLLRLPNDAHQPEDLHVVLAWLEDAFHERGFTTRRLETPGLPLLLAERPVPGAARTLLIYLQADGQPVDPARWDQASPWEPVLKERGGDGRWRELPWDRLHGARDPEWRIFARSAADSKGPVAQFLTALDILAEQGLGTAFNLKVIVDAEEELGSPNLPPAVEAHREVLAADGLVILDGPPHVSNRPTLGFGARGIATATLTTFGPRVPQHSGHYGNYVPNPAWHLARILSSMKDDDGRVTLPGWYDDVELDAETRRLMDAVPDDEPAIRQALGFARADAIGESLQEAVQYPSLNIRGLASGWVGQEARTIIPATATAELDIRLVPETDPHRLLDLVRTHIRDLGYHLVDGEPTEDERRTHPRLAALSFSVAYGAFRTPVDSELGTWLRAALADRYGRDPILIRTSGGSIPIAPFVTTLGVPAVSVPTVNPDNNQHSPNENLRVGNFVDGIAVITSILAREW